LAAERPGDLARGLVVELVEHAGRSRQNAIGLVVIKGRRRTDVDGAAQGVAVAIWRQALDHRYGVDAFRRQEAEANAAIEVVVGRTGAADTDAVHGVVVQLGRQATYRDPVPLARRVIAHGIDARQA